MKKLFLFAVVCFSFLTAHSQTGKSDFVLWQLPSQINTIGNSYVFRMNNGKVVVMDGGVKEEALYSGTGQRSGGVVHQSSSR
jgi:hypothetical protein